MHRLLIITYDVHITSNVCIILVPIGSELSMEIVTETSKVGGTESSRTPNQVDLCRQLFY